MARLLGDLVFAVRTTIKSPGLMIAGITALALGIGANTAIFSLADALLFKPLNIPDATGVIIAGETPQEHTDPNGAVAPANYRDWVSQNRSFEGLAAFRYAAMSITSGNYPERLVAIRVTQNFFQVLRGQAVIGRVLLPEEDEPGRSRVVVLSDRYWHERFNADPSVVGRTIELDLKRYVIAGVMPKNFQIPTSADLWTPLAADSAEMNDRASRNLIAIGRLRPGVSQQQATSELRAIAKRLDAQYPDTNHGWTVRTMTAREFLIGPTTGQYLVMLLVAVGFVLLIACANVANVLLARALGRQKELALRTALGASRLQLMRQLLTESLVLAGLGAALGIGIAYWETHLLVVNLPPTVARYMPNWYTITVDWRAMLFTTGVSALAGIVSGLLPAFACSRPDLIETLKEGARGSSGSYSRQRLRSLLLVGEIALSIVLLVGAGLMVRGVNALQADTDGYEPKTILTLQLSLPQTRYKEPGQIAGFFRNAVAALAEIPEIRDFAVSETIPDASHPPTQSFSIKGDAVDRGKAPSAFLLSVTPGYFRVYRMALRQGRLLRDSDDKDRPEVVVISESLARRYWPNRNPIGDHLKLGAPMSQEPWREIVGVTGDIRYDPLERGIPYAIYVPYQQRPLEAAYISARTGDPDRLIPSIRTKIATLDHELPLLEPKSLPEVVRERLIGLSYVAVMLTVLGIIALVMTCVGIYGMMSNAVSERSREIGIRMALGARAGQVILLVVRRAAVITGVGLTIGMVCSVALTRLIASLIWGVDALDWVTFCAVLLAFGGTAVFASYLPAYRASHVNPQRALRNE